MSAFLEIPSFIFSLVGKFSAAFLLFSGVVLFLPDDLAASMDVLEFRKQNLTVLWLFFILSASMFICYAFKFVWHVVSPVVIGKINSYRIQRVLLERLESLSERERLWITCCLFYNRQSMNAPITAQPPSALRSKGLLILGEGNVLDANFTIPDRLWKHLKKVRDQYVPTGMDKRQAAEFERTLQRYRESLQLY